ncbi:MAG TPA: hypothetical protein PLK13_18915 [Xanthobacteraceae bacterium]|jgi:hypothetical protein|uniref:hypothetical protein n=1 Tax=Roseixanthobacter finlandensis TaxID=3119922 RepID=UPI000BC74ABB|nr:MAG: hypothetical protein B7Y61_07630 [Rhizobiales bacterium 35-66-30]OZB04984.1 MAG: hypothetical protein B7X67_12980 [Rhizobiales bacterium 39-66-18]HQS10899.1 hypothetical protein [Xanthobacteraceae bacterium]HQS45379.1 hypothetical protein [Xanthobacteraceae bacterium]
MKLFGHAVRIPSRVAEVGWLFDQEKGTFIWDAPRKVVREEPAARHPKSVRYCPAVIDHDARLFEVVSPIDMHLRFLVDEKTRVPSLVNGAGDQSNIRAKHLGQMISLVSAKEWRHPERPILQLITPYVFVADEPIYINQLPPFNHYRPNPLPGLLIGGRFPIENWPRQLMWAFEWHEPKKDIIIKRGEPLFYARFETVDPSRPIRMVEAEMTPELRRHIDGMSGVTNYVNRTFSLFDVARQRRPKKLLTKKS